MTKELDKELNEALELIERRNKLIEKIKSYSAAEAYMNTPPVEYSAYKRQYVPEAKAWGCGSNALFLGSVLLLIYGFLSLSFKIIGFAFLVMIIGAVCGTVGSSMKKKRYNAYMMEDRQKREQYQVQMKDLQDLRGQLDRLNKFMSDPQNCIIPQGHWHQAYEIAAYIRKGRAESVEEAIDLLTDMGY